MGCDPVDLEQMVPRCAAVAAQLRADRATGSPGRTVAGGADRPPAAAGRRSRTWRHGSAVPPSRWTWPHGASGRTPAAQRRASLGAPPVTVLRSSAEGDGRWVARTGDADAQVVVVLVPGVGTELADRHELARDARRVWEQLAIAADRDGADPDGVDQGGVAVISWLGYDPPDHLVGGLARGPAVVGGAGLAADVRRLRRAGAARVVVVGHSYGGLVAARASAAGMRADEVVLLGAPGLGVPDRASLRLAAGAELWAASARGDAVSLLARTGVGPRPRSAPRRPPPAHLDARPRRLPGRPGAAPGVGGPGAARPAPSRYGRPDRALTDPGVPTREGSPWASP